MQPHSNRGRVSYLYISRKSGMNTLHTQYRNGVIAKLCDITTPGEHFEGALGAHTGSYFTIVYPDKIRARVAIAPFSYQGPYC